MGSFGKYIIAGCLLLASPLADALRVRRVQAGKRYNEHDQVDIVVNKVG